MALKQRRLRTATAGHSAMPVEMFLINAEAWLIDAGSQAADMTAANAVYAIANPDTGDAAPYEVAAVRVLATAGAADTKIRVIAVKNSVAAAGGFSAATAAAGGPLYVIKAGATAPIEFAISPGYTLIVFVVSGGLAAVGSLEIEWILGATHNSAGS